MSTAVRTLRLRLPESIHRRLRDAAEETNQPATALARRAIEAWLREHNRAVVRADIARYAAEVAGSEDDLNETLVAASMEDWQRPKPTKRRRW